MVAFAHTRDNFLWLSNCELLLPSIDEGVEVADDYQVQLIAK
jgi:hypothetical protein